MSTDVTTLPVVTLSSDKVPTTNSRDVAEFFGRAHKTVLSAIDRLECSEDFNRQNFMPVDYVDEKGRTYRSFNMTKDGFVFLVMGFTGKKAASIKEAYIAAFNAMEAELKLRAEAEADTLRQKVGYLESRRQELTVDEFRAEKAERWPHCMAGAVGLAFGEWKRGPSGCYA